MHFVKKLALGLGLLVAPFALPAAAATGPHPVSMEVDPSLRYHTIFRPVDLARAGAGADGLPVVVFAGGGCRNAGGRFRELLSEVASHGYLVIALGEIGDPDHDANPDNEVNFRGRPTKTDVTQIDYAIEWAAGENRRDGSIYRSRLDPARLAVMGQSCGGMQAIDVAAREPRVKTLVVLNSGTWPDDREMGGTSVKRADLARITAPTLILLGGKGDVAWENGMGDFDRMSAAPVFLGDADYGHRATYFAKDGGLYGKVAVAWLNWMLRGDARAAAMFSGPDCGLCRDREWTVKRRNLEAVRVAR